MKCILVLGPEFINIDSEEVDFTESIHDYLISQKFEDLAKGHYLSDDGFLFYESNEDTFDIMYELGEFYKGLNVSESYRKLTRIPFSSIISLSPDNLMVKAFDQIKKDYSFCKYKYDGFDEGPLETSKEKPMIYNLFGHYENFNCLIFTFNNLFAFLDKIFQDQGKQNLRKHIKEANSFLFLGFNYDKWYLKLIFYLLEKFRQENTSFSRMAIFDYKDKKKLFDPKINYYKTSFKMNFSPENEKKFIDDLFNACREKGILTDIRSLEGTNIDVNDAKQIDKYRILFLAASPEGKMVLRVGEKFLSIEEALNPDYYELLRPNYKVKRGDILTLVNKDYPNMLYFNCHGSSDGQLILNDKDDKSEYLPLEDLKEMISELAKEHTQINCVVFSACKSDVQAMEISKIVPYCIGMKSTVLEEVSDVFTKGFFEAFIKDSQNFEYAFNVGKLAIKNSANDKLREFHGIPILYKEGKVYEKAKVRDEHII